MLILLVANLFWLVCQSFSSPAKTWTGKLYTIIIEQTFTVALHKSNNSRLPAIYNPILLPNPNNALVFPRRRSI